jgi:putative ABC transport system permease protein
MIKQILSITGMSMLSLPQRVGSAAAVIIGITVTVAVIVSVLAMSAGLDHALKGNSRLDRIIVTRQGATSEIASLLSREDVSTIMEGTGVKRDTDGRPIASAEVVALVTLPQKASGTDANVTLRGVGPKMPSARPEVHLIAGRMFRPAIHELIAGRSATMQFAGLEVGRQITLHDSQWTLVGIFEDGGDSHESELEGDAETVLAAYRRNMFQSVTVLLQSPDAFEQYRSALASHPKLGVDAKRETDYYAARSERLAKLLKGLAFFVGGVMALGAMFAALNTMYSAVADRLREVATLRAIGFAPVAVLIAVVLESMSFALLGSLIGCALAWEFFNGNTVNTLGANFSQIVFRFTVTWSVLGTAVIAACAIGALGGFFPAVRAIRIPVAAAFRAG